MRISDWSSDVCSSYLVDQGEGAVAVLLQALHAPRHLAAQSAPRRRQQRAGVLAAGLFVGAELTAVEAAHELALDQHLAVLAHGADDGAFAADRKSGGQGKRGSVRVDPGCRRFIKKKNNTQPK